VFRKKFNTKDLCKEYLYSSKGGNGYICLRCKQARTKKGIDVFDKRCANFGYNGTVTSNILFHSIKFSLTIAFEIIYRISVNKKELSSF
jgi:hypothetical protein